MLRSRKCRLQVWMAASPFPCSCMLGRRVNRTTQQALGGFRRPGPPNIWLRRRRRPRTRSSKIDAEPVSSCQRPQDFPLQRMSENDCLESAQVDQKTGRDVCSISSRACRLQNTANPARPGMFQGNQNLNRRSGAGIAVAMKCRNDRAKAECTPGPIWRKQDVTSGPRVAKVKCRFQPSATRRPSKFLSEGPSTTAERT